MPVPISLNRLQVQHCSRPIRRQPALSGLCDSATEVVRTQGVTRRHLPFARSRINGFLPATARDSAAVVRQMDRSSRSCGARTTRLTPVSVTVAFTLRRQNAGGREAMSVAVRPVADFSRISTIAHQVQPTAVWRQKAPCSMWANRRLSGENAMHPRRDRCSRRGFALVISRPLRTSHGRRTRVIVAGHMLNVIHFPSALDSPATCSGSARYRSVARFQTMVRVSWTCATIGPGHRGCCMDASRAEP